jgi:hypothetical protein
MVERFLQDRAACRYQIGKEGCFGENYDSDTDWVVYLP